MGRHRILAICTLLTAAQGRGLAQTRVDLRTQAKAIDFSALTTKPFQVGSNLPTECTLGQAYFLTAATAGQNLYSCSATNVWTRVGQMPHAVSTVFGRAGDVAPQTGDYSASQVTDAVDRTAATAYTPGARQTFTPNSAAAGLRITPGALPSAPQTGDLVIDAGDGNRLKAFDGNVWSGAMAAAASGNYAATFTSQTSVTILGSDHKLASANLLVACYDNGTPPQEIEPNTVTVDGTTFDATITFSSPQSGRCAINGSGGGGSGGGGAVASVFGRSGSVTAQTGDYSFSQLTGSVADGQVAAGLSAGKIGAGVVDNERFGYLANARSDIQQQIDGKSDTSHSHTIGGDASGSLSSVTVTKIQNRGVAPAAPQQGQALVWNSGTSQWEPGNVAAGGSGASMAAQLGDFTVNRTSNTVLTIGAGCTSTTPCNVRVGGTVYTYNSSSSVTLGTGTGILFLYMDSLGVLTAGHNLTLASISGAVEKRNVSAFPANGLPLYTWTASNGVWDSAGGSDKRAFLSTKVLTAGTGIALLEAGQSLISVDTALVPTYVTGTAVLNFPAIPAGTCSADMTFALSGAATGDAVAPGWPAALEAGLTGTMRVSAADQAAVRLCNLSAATVDPAAATFRATVVRSF